MLFLSSSFAVPKNCTSLYVFSEELEDRRFLCPKVAMVCSFPLVFFSFSWCRDFEFTAFFLVYCLKKFTSLQAGFLRKVLNLRLAHRIEKGKKFSKKIGLCDQNFQRRCVCVTSLHRKWVLVTKFSKNVSSVTKNK